MRVLMLHERYRRPGGEDSAFEDDVALLRGSGVEVATHVLDHNAMPEEGNLRLALRSLWSAESYAQVSRLILDIKPQVLHVHNNFPLLSPSVYDAGRDANLAVVQSLYNFRLLCPNALLLRDARPCEECLHRLIKWPGILHACYRNSPAASAAVALWAGWHQIKGTWRHKVDRFIALGSFSRDRFIDAGFSANQIAIKPAGCPDPGRAAASWDQERNGVLFIGRLSDEKGLAGLLEAWRGLDVPLTVIGGGPLSFPDQPHVRFLGHQPREAVSRAMSSAQLLVMPYLSYETGPVTLFEAFAHGLPVLASDRGSMGAVIEPNVTGWLARPDDVADWRDKAQAMLAQPGELRRMGLNARQAYEERYAPNVLFARTMEIYRQALEARP